MTVNDQYLKIIHEKMDYKRILFTRLREILRSDFETMPMSTVLETDSDDEVCKMEQELEDFKKELYKNLLNDESRVHEKKIIIDHLENLADEEYVKTVYGSMENIPVVFSQVPYEMFKLEQKRFYAERRGQIIKFKHEDSEIFEIIGKGLENLEMQSNGLLMV